MLYRVAADAVAAVHVAWVLAVVLGLVLFLVGGARGWRWVRDPRVRVAHLAMIGLVVARATLWSDVCPLTTWEYDLRALGGQLEADGTVNYESTPVGAVLHGVIHPPLPRWAFPVVYSAFGLLVLATFWFVPVRRHATPREDPACSSS
ncbi:MAG: DUF2784 domain-containing protein [Gemmataceae bacterium]